MKAVRIHENRGPANPELLVLEDAPDPHAATGDVIVRVHAASFVPDELDWPGTWTDRAGRDRTPCIPAHEVAGVVTEVGYGTTGFEVGDRVFGLTDWHRDGGAAEYVAVEARNLAAIPDTVGFQASAALPLAGLTAWRGMFRHGGLEFGDAADRTVVVHGGAGGTGSLVVQLAHAAGSRVVATGRRAAEERARATAQTNSFPSTGNATWTSSHRWTWCSTPSAAMRSPDRPRSSSRAACWSRSLRRPR